MKKTVPYLPVHDIDDAVKFYEEKMGFSSRYKDTKLGFLLRDDVEIHLWSASDEKWKLLTEPGPIVSGAESFLAGTASCRIEVVGIDDLFKEYKENGVLHSQDTVVEEKPWGTREFAAKDLHGNLLAFFEQNP